MNQQDLFDVGDRREAWKGGYARPPGSGPDGETCKTCRHYYRAHYHDQVHLKCELMRAHWTHGPGSDIKARAPACRMWEADSS